MSDSQTMPSLGATGSNDPATALGTHSDQKTMRPFAAHDRGLISTFHGTLLAAQKNI
jgi:hypothetical protein